MSHTLPNGHLRVQPSEPRCGWRALVAPFPQGVVGAPRSTHRRLMDLPQAPGEVLSLSRSAPDSITSEDRTWVTTHRQEIL